MFLSALGALGGSLTFGIFLVLSVFAIGFVYVLAPETKGRQLEAIRAYWYNGGRWPDETEARARPEASTRTHEARRALATPKRRFGCWQGPQVIPWTPPPS